MLPWSRSANLRIDWKSDAKIATAVGAVVGSVGGGSVDIDGMSIYMRFDEETLKGIAGITQAEYFHAASAQDLKKIYESLNTKFALERKETEISALFAAAAALLAVASAVLSLLWFNRLV
jgi:Ca-activated chloride channel family protein